MNIKFLDLLNDLADCPYDNQRLLAERCGLSLGMVNAGLRALTEEGLLDGQMALTDKARALLAERAPKNAVILAAGTGMRMVPINTVAPKGLLEVHGETLIERLIRQLHEAGVRQIYVIVGYMKEQFEYLIDEYGVELIVNPDYSRKNNLCSLALAAEHLGNTYVVPGDIWCADGPFSARELYSWYMVSDRPDSGSDVRVNRKNELVTPKAGETGCAMIGIAYLTGDQARIVRERLEDMSRDSRYAGCFWEQALYEKWKMLVPAKVVPAAAAVEINTYEQLRDLDENSLQLRSDALAAAAKALGVGTKDIRDISILKKGMTNRSFIFSCGGRRYIMRVPGEGTERMINRSQEAAVYKLIKGRGLCDDPVYLDPSTGYKMTYYVENARCCDPEDAEDLRRCMEKLRQFHRMGLQADHDFDIFGSIDFYESLWAGAPSVYRDHAQTKRNVFALRPYIDAHAADKVLTHIDAVPDNFLFAPDGSVQLIDWEYAGMQDPHVDVAMFCIYAMYDKGQVDRLIDIYFEGDCPLQTRAKIYCYIAACGLLWSDWCEYKRIKGVEFGAYSLRQYRYAKEYCRYAREAMENV